ncbi:MAG: alanine racemase [Sedimentisphaerales bacterium]|nr:alanine racemase [Sedimentisphaerales bacterium]
MNHAQLIIKEYYDVSDGQLVIGKLPITEIVRRHETPFYLYSPEVFRMKIRKVTRALPGFEIYYSVKANPAPDVIQIIMDEGCGLNVATRGELILACKCNCPPGKIILAGAGKTEKELDAGIVTGVCEIHVESIEEIEKLSILAKKHDEKVQVAIRLNPGQVCREGKIVMAEKAAAYGFDEADLGKAAQKIICSENLELCGIHVYFGTQILNKELLLGCYEYAFEMAKQLVSMSGCKLRTIDFSGGFGVPYYSNEKEFAIDEFGQQLGPIIKQVQKHEGLSQARLVIEPGRYLLSEGGLYVTRVIGQKSSYGRQFIIVDGGMHHHLAASGNLGHVIKRNFPIVVANRLVGDKTHKYDITGRQCSALDTLAREVELPTVETGDILVFFQSGAYARSASPLGFRSHPVPPELIAENGTVRLMESQIINDSFQDAPLGSNSKLGEQRNVN